MSKYFSILLAVLILIITGGNVLAENSPLRIVVGSETGYPPYAIVTEDGQADGFSVDLMKAVCKAMGIDVTFRVGPWNEVIASLENGEIDALPLVSYSDERDKVLDFTVPHTKGNGVFLKRKGSPSITSIDELGGKAIIVMNSDATHDWLKRNSISKNLVLTGTVPDALQALAAGEHDYVLAPHLVGLLIVKELGLTNLETTGQLINVHGRGYGFAVKEGNSSLLAQFNEGLNIIKATGQYDRIYDKWFGILDPKGVPTATISLTSNERQYLTQKREVTFCIDPDWMPFEAIRNGNLNGMTSDFKHLFEDRLGIPFRFVPTDNWAQSQSFAEAGKCDILPMVSITPAREKYLTFTPPYLSYSVGIIARNDLPFISGLYDLEKFNVGIGKGSSIWDHAHEMYPNGTFVDVDGVKDGLLKVSSGEIKAYLIAVPVATDSIKNLGLTNLKVAGHIEVSKSLRIGISRQSPQLAPIMVKLTNALSKEDVDSIYRKWVALRFEHTFNYDLIWKIGAVLLIVMTGIVLWNRKLSRLNKEILLADEELRASKEQTERSEKKYSLLFNRMQSAFALHEIICDDRGVPCDYRFLDINPAFENMTDLQRQDVVGKTVRELMPGIEDHLIKTYGEVALTGKSVNFEYFSQELNKHFEILAFRPQKGHFAVIFTNITERMAVDEELKRAKTESENANLAKTKFLATASHDLRQPLQAAHLFLYALASKNHDHESREIISNLEASVSSLDNLLNSLLDISRLEAGLVEAKIEAFSLNDFMARIAKDYNIIIDDTDKRVKLKVVETNAIVCSDVALFETILRNLISNALKNTKKGKVLLGCRHHGDSVTLEVWDNGCGIPADRLTDIFVEFVQIGNEGRNRKKGLGLGLSIVDKLAKILNHNIQVRSWEGRGSVFSIELPLSNEKGISIQIEENTLGNELAKETIFIVEDEPAIRASLSLTLEQMGYDTFAVCGHDFKECEELITKRTSRPDMILADYRLQNGLTGLDAINFFNEAYKVNIPAILLTGDTAPERLIEVKRSGLKILHKPINPEKLLTEIKKTLQSVNAQSKNV